MLHGLLLHVMMMKHTLVVLLDDGIRIWNLFLLLLMVILSLLNVLLLVIMLIILIPKDKDGNTLPSHGYFKFVTVQDVTYIINETKKVLKRYLGLPIRYYVKVLSD